MADYSLEDYGRMLADGPRIAAYAQAIRDAVRPGSVVLELGTGTGFMALLACRAGAAKVHAVEPNPVVQIGRKIARDNGCADRIVFHRCRSTELELPERCDVLISDLRGMTACAGSHLADLMDARSRLLTPEARWICQSDRLQVAVAEIPNPRVRFLAQWDGEPWGVDLRATLPHATNSLLRHSARPADLLTNGATWAVIDYPRLQSPHVRGTAVVEVIRDGEAHGLALWFDATLWGGAQFSTEPAREGHVYGNSFLPWPRAVALRRGDRIELRIDVVASAGTYQWSWRSVVRRDGEAQPAAEFNQSRFQGMIAEPGHLVRCFPDFTPQPGPESEVEKFLLERIDGRTPQGELAAALQARFPLRYGSAEAALNRVIATAERTRESR